MSSLTIYMVRPLYSRATIAQLGVVLRYVKLFERVSVAMVFVASSVFLLQFVQTQAFATNSAASSRPATLTSDNIGQYKASAPAGASGSSSAHQRNAAAGSPETMYGYGTSNTELQAVLSQWQAKYPHITLSASFQEVGGQNRVAHISEDKLFVTASMYKLFLATFLMQQIETGAVPAESPAVNGKTTGQCIETMLVHSENVCAEYLGKKYGWSKLHAYVRSVGLTTTKLNISPLQSTSSDTALFLQKLQAGQLLNTANTAKIRQYMELQTQRRGIPAGSPLATVQNRVGYDRGIFNDAAIVASPTATYILVVYSSSGSPEPTRDLASQIHALLHR